MASSIIPEREDWIRTSIDRWYKRQREKQASRVALECKLLKGAISFDAPPPQQPQLEGPPSRPVLTSFITKDRCIDHSLVAASAVHELYALALDKDGLFWTNEGILNQIHYQQTFPRPESPEKKGTIFGLYPCTLGSNHPNSWTHASRASAVVKMEHACLAKMFTIDDDWEQLFPSIVSEATGLRFLSPGSSSSNPDGSVQLLQIQLQATTPIVPGRTFVILRTCKQIDHLTWVVADVSVDSSLNVGYPCGCLIQGREDGLSQVTWVEHLEFEKSYLDPKLYNDLCCRGFAFGAERWAACLERSCDRSFYYGESDFLPSPPLQDSYYEKECVMSFSKRMVRAFCLNIALPVRQSHRSSYVPAPCQSLVSLKIRKSPYHDDPREMVLLATTTFSLPHSPEFVLEILGDERRRQELDAFGKIGQLKEVACYTTGDDPRNKISVQANLLFGNELLLQETSVSQSGSLVVWSLVRSEPFNRLGEDPHGIPLIGLSGVAICSNGHQNSCDTSGGSYVTLGLQQEARHIKGLGPKLIESFKKCVDDTVNRLVEVLNNPKDEGSSNKRKRKTDGKVMMEYIGATGKPVTFDEVPIEDDIDFNFILSFAIDADESGNPQNGNFKPYWEQSLTPDSVADVKAKHPNVKVLASLSGWSIGSTTLRWYKPANSQTWISNAFKSLKSIIQTSIYI